MTPRSLVLPLGSMLVALAAAADPKDVTPPTSKASVPALVPISAVTERGEDGVIFTVEVPALAQEPATISGEAFTRVAARGFGLTMEPGRPSLPFRTFTIAVPPDRVPVPQVTVLAAETLDLVPAPAPEPTMDPGSGDKPDTPGYRDIIDRAFYAGGSVYPELLFTASPLSWLRQQQVFDLTVNPVRYDPASRRLTVARRLEVRVDFRPRPGRAPAHLPAPFFDRGFESIYRNTLINYESARRFRAGPLADAAFRTGAGPRDDPELKISLSATGVVRLSFNQLAGRGLPAGIPIGDLAVAERRYADGPPPADNFPSDPLPIQVFDANQNGVFDSGDAIDFYGRSYRRRVAAEAYLMRSTETNIVWLKWNAPGGARISTRPGWFEPPPPLSAASFPDTLHFEEDHIYIFHAPRLPGGPTYAAHEAVLPWYLTRDFPFVGGPGVPADPYCDDPNCRAHRFPFTLHEVDVSQPATASVLMVSHIDGFTHLGTFILSSNTRDDTLAYRWGFSGHQAARTWQSDPFPSSLLTRPSTSFKFIGERRTLGDTTQPTFSKAGAFLDWFEISYPHLYRARDNRLLMTSGGASGPTEFRIDGFSAADSILVYDVTDPLNPVRLAGVSQIGGSEVRFRDDVVGQRRYAAFARGAGELTLNDAAIAYDEPSHLATPAAEPDYILVIPDAKDFDGDGNVDDFAGEAQRLKDHRESHGLRVEIARFSDICDEFDGGLSRPQAIRNYLRYAFSHWSRPPQYLLLAGDGSEDLRDKLPTGINLIPTQMIFGPVSGGYDYEMVSCDSWFVSGLGPTDGEFDLHFDMAEGRLPAQSTAELRLMVDKIIAYENYDPGERWRAKTLTISDDAWSSTISFDAVYQFRSNELVFERICDSLNTMVENHSGIGDLIDTRAIKVSTYTSQLPDSDHTQARAIAHFDTTGSRLLYQLISEGNLIMNYQGHANRVQLAHEFIFNSFSAPYHQNFFNNLGRPGIWFLYACHPNEFEAFDERITGRVNGVERTVGELLIAKPNSGLIASIASSGYELLPGIGAGGQTFVNDLNTPQWQAFFLTPPEESPDRPRWILGEVINLGKELFTQANSLVGPEFTYCLLGDPALRLDAVPPRFAVTAADTTRSPGDRIELYSAKSDSVVIAAEIRDEVRVDTAEVLERKISGQQIPVDPALWSISYPDTSRPNRLNLVYRAPLRPDDYDIVLTARDASDRLVEFPLAVRVDATFRAEGDPISPGDFVPAKATLDVDVHSPVPLTGSEFRLLVDNVPLVFQAEGLGPLGKDWRLHSTLFAATGRHTLTLAITYRGSPALSHSIDFQVETALSLRQVAAYPNPFDAFTAFTYQLTNAADDVAVRIYTISGRLVREIDGNRLAGFSQVGWDGRDQDGNEVANGLYLFRVVAHGGGKTDDFTGRLVRARR